MDTIEYRLRIRNLNDAFRKTFAGGKMVMTANMATTPDMVKASALVKPSEFYDVPENDPHGEPALLALSTAIARSSGNAITTTRRWTVVRKIAAILIRQLASAR